MTRTLALATVALFASCSDSSGPASPSPAPMPPPPPAPDPTATYRVTFEATWSAATHPNMAPSNPHFSGLIGATHQRDVHFWETGAIASNGIEAMAERGSKTPLDMEIGRAIDAGFAQFTLSGGNVPVSPGEVSLDFTITTEHPYVTLVSMVAPSPDWFVGVDNLSLMENGDWVSELVVELEPYDAGTDDGRTFTSRDADTAPREPIAHITEAPLATNGVAPPMGTFTFRRQ